MMLHNDLYDKTLKNERLGSELNETYRKLTKIVEKRNLVEARLPKQMDFMMKEAQREYLESNEFQGMFNHASALILRNDWRLGLAQLRLSEAYGTIGSLHYKVDDLEGRWKARSEFMERELEKIRATMLSYALIEDTSTSSSDN
ncbi:hypothetical protein Dimus_007698 [Dionaea muscipula]